MYSVEIRFFSVLGNERHNCRIRKVIYFSEKHPVQANNIGGGGGVIAGRDFVVNSSRHIANCAPGMNMELKDVHVSVFAFIYG